MATLCSSTDVLDLIGPGANADISASAAIINRYIERAEGCIAAETRKAWVAEYAQVAAITKEILKQAAASHAAKHIIQNDMSGFVDSQEAIAKMNIQFDEYQKAVKILSDTDSVRLRGVND